MPDDKTLRIYRKLPAIYGFSIETRLFAHCLTKLKSFEVKKIRKGTQEATPSKIEFSSNDTTLASQTISVTDHNSNADHRGRVHHHRVFALRTERVRETQERRRDGVRHSTDHHLSTRGPARWDSGTRMRWAPRRKASETRCSAPVAGRKRARQRQLTERPPCPEPTPGRHEHPRWPRAVARSARRLLNPQDRPPPRRRCPDPPVAIHRAFQAPRSTSRASSHRDPEARRLADPRNPVAVRA